MNQNKKDIIETEEIEDIEEIEREETKADTALQPLLIKKNIINF